jgi:hypothetical protein
MRRLTKVKTVLEDQIKRPSRECLAAIFRSVGPLAALAFDADAGKLLPQRADGFQREIAPIDVDDDARLFAVDDQLALTS